MKNLQEIKNTYAIEQGYDDWETFLNYYGGRHPEWFDQHWQEICIRAQKAALEKAAENAEITCSRKTTHCKQCYGGGCENPIVEKESITNPENLIR